jgi:BURP domain
MKVQCAFLYDYIIYNPFPSPAYIRSNFYLKKDLYPGAQIREGVNLNKTIIGNTFVPRVEADAIPFSLKNLPKILDYFSIVPGSDAAKQMEKIINACKASGMEGEKKFCSTSLESMIDNVISLLGTHNVQVISTTINGVHEKMPFNITSPIKKFPDKDRLVICHPVPSPHAMHYCHSSAAYEGYIMRLVGKDGSIVNAATVCHHDTINFKHSILDLLKVKPGTEPICHILPEDHFFWIHKR